MSSPSKEVLPKIDEDLKTQLENKSDLILKHVGPVEEKVILPTNDEILHEKGQQQLLQGIIEFNESSLKPVETKEKCVLPTAEAIAKEKSEGPFIG